MQLIICLDRNETNDLFFFHSYRSILRALPCELRFGSVCGWKPFHFKGIHLRTCVCVCVCLCRERNNFDINAHKKWRKKMSRTILNYIAGFIRILWTLKRCFTASASSARYSESSLASHDIWLIVNFCFINYPTGHFFCKTTRAVFFLFNRMICWVSQTT